MAQSFSHSRRVFLAGGLAVVGGAGGLLLADRQGVRLRNEFRHRSGGPGAEVPRPVVLATLAAYLGAYFGRNLTPQDEAELADRLTFAATRDSGWGKEYESAAALLDEACAGRGFPSFMEADRETRLAVIEDLRQPLRGPLAGVRLRASDSVRARERMRVSTSRHLVRLYRHSGVPWRQHGFPTWPGAPDRVSAYDRLRDG